MAGIEWWYRVGESVLTCRRLKKLRGTFRSKVQHGRQQPISFKWDFSRMGSGTQQARQGDSCANRFEGLLEKGGSRHSLRLAPVATGPSSYDQMDWILLTKWILLLLVNFQYKHEASTDETFLDQASFIAVNNIIFVTYYSKCHRLSLSPVAVN